MFSKTAIGLAAASFMVAAAAFTPVMANYAPCYENPAGKGCPGEINQNTSAQSHRGAEYQMPRTHHHG